MNGQKESVPRVESNVSRLVCISWYDSCDGDRLPVVAAVGAIKHRYNVYSLDLLSASPPLVLVKTVVTPRIPVEGSFRS